MLSTSPPVRHVNIGSLTFGNDLPLVLIAGPCQMESRTHTLDIAGKLAELCATAGISLVFKVSFDKANRTSLTGRRGVGLTEALPVFEAVRKEIGCPVITDVHESWQCAEIAPVVDILQIPAFLCRQTDLLVAAARTKRVVNVKKGQFLAPWDMKHVVSKLDESENRNVIITERGTSFGYNTLVVDMRGLPIMAQETGCPIIMDATHAVQQPGGQGTSSGGQRVFAPVLARAAVSLGIAGIFVETHEDPDNAPSDGPNTIPLHDMPRVIQMLADFDRLAKAHPLSLVQE